MSRTALALVLTLSGCTDDESDGSDGADGSDWTPPEGGVVSLTTEDGITLEADYYPSAVEGAPAIVLLHMNPVYFDRTDWPSEFIATLGAHDWAVLVPDRRGAGGSEGDAQDAFTGENGKYDAAASVARVEADGYGDIVVIGASNGTTTAIDYTIWAATGAATVPVALGFMTGGTYTETNNTMASLPALPSVFTYSTAESGWSIDQQPLDPGSWAFFEYPDGDHGTKLFDAAPEVSDDLVAFLDGVL